MADILPLLNYLHTSQEKLLLIAEDIDDTVFGMLVANVMKKVVNLCVIKAPGFGFNVRHYLDDLSVLTGCTVFAEETKPLDQIDPLIDFGHASKVIVNGESTVIMTDKDARGDIEGYVSALKTQLNEVVENKYSKESLANRIAKLSKGVAVISVGATSDVEQQELKLRLEDAINATKAAYRGGVVAGGGMALKYISCEMGKATDQEFSCAEARLAHRLMTSALAAPAAQVLLNSDIAPIETSFISPLGYNARTREYGDMFKMGILDPTLVVKSALTNAISIACTLLTAEASIIAEDSAE
jgi:chaperonin GroEL